MTTALDRVDPVAALMNLLAPQGKAIVLCYRGDLSFSEIPELSEASAGTVKSSMARARSTLWGRALHHDATAIPYRRVDASVRSRDGEPFTSVGTDKSTLVPTDLGIAVTDPLAAVFDAFRGTGEPVNHRS